MNEREPFKKLYVRLVHPKVTEAGLSTVEYQTWECLTVLSHQMRGNLPKLQVRESATQLAEMTGRPEQSIRRALGALTKKTFTWGGYNVPVLTRLKHAGPHMPSLYQDNLTAYTEDPDGQPPKNALQHGEGVTPNG